MKRDENIYVGHVLKYQKDQAIIQVSEEKFHISLTSKESDFLEDMLYNVKLPYVAFDIANKTIITYEIFQQAMGAKNSRDVYITFIKMFKN